MAIMTQKLSYDTEGRISCSLLSTRLNSWGSAIIFRLDVEEKANLDKQDLFRLFIEILNN